MVLPDARGSLIRLTSMKLSRRSQKLGLTILLLIALIDAAGPLLLVADELHSADAIVVIGGDPSPSGCCEPPNFINKVTRR